MDGVGTHPQAPPSAPLRRPVMSLTASCRLKHLIVYRFTYSTFLATTHHLQPTHFFAATPV